MADHEIAAELFYDGQWNAMSTYNRKEVTITRGQGDEVADPVPSTGTITADNRSGDYNPRNVTGSLYGKIGRNTPIRIKIDGDVRATQEIAAYNPDRGYNDAWCDISAAGILRRLGQGASTLPSTVRRYIETQAGLLAYWPCEDGTTASAPSNAVPGGAPAAVNDVTFGPDDTLPASGGAMTFNSADSLLSAPIPSAPVTSFISPVLLFKLDAIPAGDFELFRVQCSGGDVGTMTITMSPTVFGRNVYKPNGDALVESAIGHGVDVTEWTAIHFGLFQESPGTIRWTWVCVNAGSNTFFGTNATFSGTLGRATQLRIGPNANKTNAKFAHIAVTNEAFGFVAGGLASALAGWAGYEDALSRIERLCDENNIPFTSDGDAVTTEDMGVQQPATLVDLLAEARRTDDGMLYEPRDALGLHYRTRTSLYNQTPTLTLDWAAGELAEPMTPVIDDLGTRNDVTAKNVTGGEYRVVIPDGPLSVEAPPDGVGRYETSVDVSYNSDGRLPLLASWLARKGTIDETRFPQVTVDLDLNPHLATDAGAVDIGDLIRITSVPLELSPDDVDLIVVGYTETATKSRRKITFNCVPAEAYRVGVWDDPGGDVLYSFDSTSQSWAGETGVVVARVTTPTPHDGAGMLRATKTMSAGFDSIRFNDASGQPNDISGNGPMLAMWALVPSGAPGSDWAAHIEVQDNTFTWQPGPNVALTPGTWALLTWEPPTALLADSRAIGVQFEATGVSGSQSVYIDTVKFAAPTSARWSSADTNRPGVTPISSTQTSITFDTPSGLLWTEDPAHFPFDINVGGERMRVTGIASDTGTRQVFTVIRSINGVVKGHPAGVKVHLWKPARYAL